MTETTNAANTTFIGLDDEGDPDEDGTFSPGNCRDCSQRRSNWGWCQHCETCSMERNFGCWTSRNNMLDWLIQDTQLKAPHSEGYLEFIRFSDLEMVLYEREGHYSSVYSAVWLEGPRWDWSDELEEYSRLGPTKVSLKRLNNSQTISKAAIDKLSQDVKGLLHNSVACVFGITVDPTGCIMVVGKHYKLHDVSSFFETTMNNVTWKERLDIIWGVAGGLVYLHKNGLAHGNLHSGNILVEREPESIDARITDFGLSQRFDEVKQTPPRGVLPFLAPEILISEHHTATVAGDMYSYGIIMWQIATGIRPFYNRPHDFTLAYDICKRQLRPEVDDNTPLCYIEQMKQCCCADPTERPRANELDEVVGKWITDIWEHADSSMTSFTTSTDNRDPFIDAERRRKSQSSYSGQYHPKIHNGAIYTSRELNFPELRNNFLHDTQYPYVQFLNCGADLAAGL